MGDEKARKPNAAALTAARFEPGQSGNPGGRPAELPGFRAACRKLTLESLPDAKRRLKDKTTPTGEWTRLFEAVADRGGFLKADDQAAIETGHARLVVAAMALQTLSEEQRRTLLQALAAEMASDEPDAG